MRASITRMRPWRAKPRDWIVLAFYALIGFDDSVNVAEETRNPSRTYPRAIFGARSSPGVFMGSANAR